MARQKTQIDLSREVVGPPYRNPENGIPQGLPQPSDEQRIRANQISRRDDDAQNLTVGLYDIDEAILYYFNNVIKPVATVNGTEISVPVQYADPERWKSIQNDGIYRDKDGKRQLPVILFKRDSLEKNRNITSKVDANNPHNFYITSQTYSARNSYGDFNKIRTRIPEKVYILTVVPDYVKITYSCIILTDYISQMNPIIEAINFASDSYWGDTNRFKFQSFVDSFKTDVITDQGKDRTIKTTFTVKLNGYIVPNTVNANPYTQLKRFSKTNVRVSEEVCSGPILDAIE